ncbi:MAG: Sir2 family NAD-dependent protein deacetylase [Candidatus Aureabacteria bacterium]|nr:Sir2 family NAD-dependent protein deacetylase [Candidatus Auribacterota bacterium]
MTNINKTDEFGKVLKECNNIVCFTGAGISTESGIPDYRSKGGIWENFQPVYIDEFLRSKEKRILYWQRKIELWEGISNGKPNSGHMFIKKLYDMNKLTGLITQNIDGLHEKSGLPKKIIINLHGTNLETICLDCGYLIPSEKVFAKIDLDKDVPLCPECNGFLKPNTISFGQQLRPNDLEKSKMLSESCDLMMAIGSTLVVQPAATFPMLAKKTNAKLAIITLSETPLDNYADFVFHMKIGEFVEIFSELS